MAIMNLLFNFYGKVNDIVTDIFIPAIKSRNDPDYKKYDYRIFDNYQASANIISQLKNYLTEEYKIELYPNPEKLLNYSESNIYFIVNKDNKEDIWILSSGYRPLKLYDEPNKILLNLGEAFTNKLISKNTNGKEEFNINAFTDLTKILIPELSSEKTSELYNSIANKMNSDNKLNFVNKDINEPCKTQ